MVYLNFERMIDVYSVCKFVRILRRFVYVDLQGNLVISCSTDVWQ